MPKLIIKVEKVKNAPQKRKKTKKSYSGSKAEPLHRIQYMGIKNQFNYDIDQVKIDNKNKTFERGMFKILHKDDYFKTKKAYYNYLDDLKLKGYKEVK